MVPLCYWFVLQCSATPDIDYAAIPLTLSPGIENSRNGSLCFKFAIFDDEIVEPDECIAISLEAAPDTVMIAENGTTTTLCIIDDGKQIPQCMIKLDWVLCMTMQTRMLLSDFHKEVIQ